MYDRNLCLPQKFRDELRKFLGISSEDVPRVPESHDLSLLIEAADRGMVEAQCRLSDVYCDGEYLKADYEKALQYAMLASASGCGEAATAASRAARKLLNEYRMKACLGVVGNSELRMHEERLRSFIK